MLSPPITIETARLSLRPVRVSDAAAIFEGYSSTEEGTRFVGYARHTELAQAQALAAYFESAWKEGRNFAWALHKKDDGAFVGVVDIRIEPPKADFGFSLGHAFWGQGFATEAAAPIVAWAWTRSDIQRLWALCHPDNVGSARVLEKLGLRREALLPNWLSNPQLGLAAGPRLLYSRIKG